MGQVVTLNIEPVVAPYEAAVAACVAERLKTLGHPADLVTPGALEALMEHAGGSIPRLRAALASTIFLASTEDAPHIERDHVERAVENLGVVPMTGVLTQAMEARAPLSRRRGAWAMPTMAALLVAITAAGAIFVARSGHSDAPPPPAVLSASGITALQSPPPAPLPDKPQAISAAPVPAAAPISPAPVKLPPIPPAIVVQNPPLPPNAAAIPSPAAAPAISPGGAPTPPGLTTIVLRYRQGDPWALDKLTAASESLREAGYSRIYAYPWHGKRPAAPVGYFFPADQPAAQAIANVFSRARLVSGVRRHPGSEALAVRRPSITQHPPGTVEAILP